jgi:hypothetical protein
MLVGQIAGMVPDIHARGGLMASSTLPPEGDALFWQRPEKECLAYSPPRLPAAVRIDTGTVSPLDNLFPANRFCRSPWLYHAPLVCRFRSGALWYDGSPWPEHRCRALLCHRPGRLGDRLALGALSHLKRGQVPLGQGAPAPTSIQVRTGEDEIEMKAHGRPGLRGLSARMPVGSCGHGSQGMRLARTVHAHMEARLFGCIGSVS